MGRNKIFFLISLLLICSSVILSLLSIIYAYNLNHQKMAYLEEEDIYFEYYSVIMEDGINIEGLMYVDQDLKEKEDNSVPSILIIFGINSRKEKDFDKVFNLVKLGYAVFTVELRGHGQSGGISGFIGKEVDDMREVLDYIENTYEFANISHIGLLAFSFGGGVATVLQAKDDRIYASVIYHPLSSISRFLSRAPVQYLLGSTPAIKDMTAIEDGYEACNEKNTNNLLLIHGKADDVILDDDSIKLYEKLDGDNRDDIAIEIRDGLGHGANEQDEDSFRYTILWFEHFYHDPSLNISDNKREDEIKDIEIKESKLPRSILPFDFIFYASIILFMGLTFLILPKYVWPLSDVSTEVDKFLGRRVEVGNKYKQMIIKRSILYLGMAALSGLIFLLLNPSYIYGFFIAFPLMVIAVLIFIPSSSYDDWKTEWRAWIDNDLKKLLYSISIILIPSLFFVLIYNLSAMIALEEAIPFFTSTMVIYLIIALGNILADLSLTRGWKLHHIVLLIGLRSLSLLIFFLFIPIPEVPFFGGYMIHILLIGLIGVIFWIIIIVIKLMKLIFRSEVTVILLLFLPMIIFLMNRFFRII
ncbi:MAG: serine aminopeptidase domain-containing protein [Promethearchaeota archaeon]